MLQEADSGLTQLAMESSAGRFQGDEFLLVKFFTAPLENSIKSKAEGRPIFEDAHFIQIMTPGNKDAIIKRPATDMDKQRFPEHYRKFLAREDQDAVEGTLLEEWAGVTRAQVEELKFMNIRTVEQLANLADANAQNIMGIQMLKQKAEQYLAQESDATAQLKEMKEMMAQMQAQLDAQAEKPKRKRRTKAEIEAEKAESGDVEE